MSATGKLTAAALCLLGTTAGAQSLDTYNSATGELTIPRLGIGGVTFTDVVVNVTLQDIVVPPQGPPTRGTIDTYNPLNNQLAIQEVQVGSSTYYNTVVTPDNLASVGGVAGADTYDAATGILTIPAVQANGLVYTNVQVRPGQILSQGGGLPRNALDVYANGQLTIEAVDYNGKVYTNPVITAQSIIAVGGQLAAETVMYRFTGGTTAGIADGASPVATLIVGKDGNFYGTTRYGGINDSGTVFRLTPQGVETILHTFGGSDGAHPFAGLIQDSAGNLYGTTINGGAYNQGTVFEIRAGGGEAVLYSFGASSTDGTAPYGGLILDGSGNLYGTTYTGGSQGGGTVFMLEPSTGVETVLHSFREIPDDGTVPWAGLTLGNDGNFYGTTAGGGTYNNGTVFRIQPAAAGGAYTLLYSFGSDGNGLLFDRLTLGRDGNFYGTTDAGGNNGAGGVFRITPAGDATIIYSFTGATVAAAGNDGADPFAGLMLGSDGNLYGTTRGGGTYNRGTVFRITPGAGAPATERVLYSFTGDEYLATGNTGSLDGAAPWGTLVEDANGDFYGTTTQGGSQLGGVVYRLTGVLTAH